MKDRNRSTTWALPFGQPAELELRANMIGITVAPAAPGEEPRIEAIGRNAGDLDVRIERDGSRVRVEIERQGSWFVGNWHAAVVLHVPPAITATIRTDAGSIEVHDLGPCDLDLETNAGSIRLQNVQGRLRLSADAGQIRGSGLRGGLEVETDAGQIRLSIDALDPGEHRVSTDVGEVRIDLAPGLDVEIDTRASVGSVWNDYPSRAGAPAVLRVSTDIGTVRVRTAGDPAGTTGPAGWRGPWSDIGERFARHMMERGMAHAARHEAREQRRQAGADAMARRQGPPWAPPRPEPPSHPEPAAAPGPAAEPTAEATRGPASTRAGTAFDTEVERILEMVEAGELSPRDADDLLRALGDE
jgi:hypothetical protein